MQNYLYTESQRDCKLGYSVKKKYNFYHTSCVPKLLNNNKKASTTTNKNLGSLNYHNFLRLGTYRKVQTKLDFIDKRVFCFLNHFSTSNGTKKKGKVQHL